MPKISMILRLILYVCLSAVIFSLGFRADNIGTDTSGYIEYYNRFNNGTGDVYKYEFIFYFLSWSFTSLHISVGYFFTCLCFIFCCLCGLIANKINQQVDLVAGLAATFLFTMIFFFCSPFFFNSQINVIRQGLSAAALILCYLYFIKPGDLRCALFAAICAVGFHSTAFIYIFFAGLMFYSYLTILWLVVSLAAGYTLGLTKNVLVLIPNIMHYNVLYKLMDYQNDDIYRDGHRFDFVCFTLGVGLMFHFSGTKLLPEKEKINFYLFLKIYWIMVMPFFIVGFFAYSDRWLFNGWLYLSVLSAAFFSFFQKRAQDVKPLIYIFMFLSIYVIFKTKGYY